MKNEIRDSYLNAPENFGNLSIAPCIIDGQTVKVTILGDSSGLSYLAELLRYMAGLDVEMRNMPDGARAHYPLRPGSQLNEHSCEVEICRAEAKGSGEFPSCLVPKKRRTKSRKS